MISRRSASYRHCFTPHLDVSTSHTPTPIGTLYVGTDGRLLGKLSLILRILQMVLVSKPQQNTCSKNLAHSKRTLDGYQRGPEGSPYLQISVFSCLLFSSVYAEDSKLGLQFYSRLIISCCRCRCRWFGDVICGCSVVFALEVVMVSLPWVVVFVSGASLFQQKKKGFCNVISLINYIVDCCYFLDPYQQDDILEQSVFPFCRSSGMQLQYPSDCPT